MHGGDWYAALNRLGSTPQEGLCDLSASISPYGPGPRARTRWPSLIEELDRYPDPHYTELKEAISLHYGVDTRNVVVVAGAMEAIDTLLASIRPPRLYLRSPVFSEYRDRAERQGIPVISISSPEELAEPGMLMMANPINPSGQRITSQEQQLWVEQARRTQVMVVWDEAFLEFVPEWRSYTRLGDIHDGQELVMGSLTKFYGLAGLRVGYVALSSTLAQALEKFLPPWRIAWPSAVVAREALMDEEYFADTRKWLIAERQWLRRALEPEVSWISDSVANFLLVVPHAPVPLLTKHLEGHGILIRDAASFDNVPPNAVRIAVKRRQDSERLMAAWRAFSGRST